MRPICQNCNSIQTKLKSNGVFVCKNCGYQFLLAQSSKKSGCLWSIIKFFISCIFLVIILIWLFKDNVSEKGSTKEESSSNVISKHSASSNEPDHQEDWSQSTQEKKKSIEYSQDMNDTLNVVTDD